MQSATSLKSLSVMSKSSSKSPQKKKNRFGGIRSTINTGLHMGNVKIIVPRQGEPFRRLKGSELAKLIELELEPEETIFKLLEKNNLDESNNSISKLSEIKSSKEEEEEAINTNISRCPYLLLDIRSEQEYKQYHIKTSMRFDPLLIRKDKLCNEIYRYKNKENKIIIIASDSEIEGIRIVMQLTEKFINNIFLLSTSVNNFCSRYNQFSNGTNIPAPPSEFLPKIVHFAPNKSNRLNKHKSNKNYNNCYKNSLKLNQSNLNKNNKENNFSTTCDRTAPSVTSELRSINSRFSKANSFVSTRTWIP